MKVENIAVRKIFLVNVIFLVLYTLRVHKITMKFVTGGGETLLDSAHGLKGTLNDTRQAWHVR